MNREEGPTPVLFALHFLKCPPTQHAHAQHDVMPICNTKEPDVVREEESCWSGGGERFLREICFAEESI